jgi:hypothetical protein
MKLESGWLVRTCHDAHMRCMLDHDPSFFVSMPPPIVSESDASEFFEKMNARFKAWTGKTSAAKGNDVSSPYPIIEPAKDAYWKARRDGKDETSALLAALDVAVAAATGQ